MNSQRARDLIVGAFTDADSPTEVLERAARLDAAEGMGFWDRYRELRAELHADGLEGEPIDDDELSVLKAQTRAIRAISDNLEDEEAGREPEE